MTDLFESDANADPDKVVLDGKTLATREVMQSRIDAKVRQGSMTPDEAWAAVRKEVLEYHRKGTSKKSAAPTKEATKAPAHTPKFSKEGDTYRLQINLNGVDDLSDDLLPEELRKKGMGIMEALSSGALKIDGEHPLADLLRQAAMRPSAANEAVAERALRAREQLQLFNDIKAPMQYPLVRQAIRVMPSDFNRTSLFHVGSNNLPRRFCRNERLGQIGTGVTIFYYGEELRQTDEAIFRQLVHVARGKLPWEYIELSQCPFIRDAKGTKRRLGAKDFQEVHDIIMRLRGAVLFIKNKRRGFVTCNLIIEYEDNGVDRRLLLDPRVVLLFDSYAAIAENTHSKLSSGAAKIYSYMATISETGLYPILVTSLFELLYGRMEYLETEYLRRNPTRTQDEAKLSVQKKYSDFKRKMLPNSLDELQREGLVATWSWLENKTKVAIVKNPETNAVVTETSPEEDTPA